ncbi:MAG: SDR family oxidoreductase [Spirochaetales bacterium]|nr:SDR family oxidoreductase [Spirochaetales bacterium]
MRKTENNWALITGASGGIGLEFAKQLAAKGYHIIAAARNRKKLDELCAGLKKQYGISALAVQSDLSKRGAAGSLYKAATAAGTIEILINNAGIGVFGLCENLAAADVDAMIQLNITALTLLCGSFAGYFRKQGKGYILNVGSMAGNWPEPYLASYAASKSYVNSYSIALALELRGSGVSVSCVEPGFVNTAFDDNAQIKSENYRKFSSKNSLSAARVASIGLRMMFRKKRHGIAGAANKVAAFFTRMLPKTLQAAIIKTSVARLIKDSRN